MGLLLYNLTWRHRTFFVTVWPFGRSMAATGSYLWVLQQLNEWWLWVGWGWWWCITMVLMLTDYFIKVFVRFYFFRPYKLSSDNDSSRAVVCVFGDVLILSLCLFLPAIPCKLNFNIIKINSNFPLVISFLFSCHSGKVSETPLQPSYNAKAFWWNVVIIILVIIHIHSRGLHQWLTG